MKLKSLKIGELTAKVPIIQGGMGIGISLSGLAGAVALEGGIGIISAAQPGFLEEDFAINPLQANLRALRRHIQKAKEIASGGIIGVNVMCAANHYSEYIRCCVESGADLVISGAGLPMELPRLVEGSKMKIAPIVSPPKAAKVLLKMWDKRFGRTADMVVIEGPDAGGHLGYDEEETEVKKGYGYDDEVKEILSIVKDYEEKYRQEIPVVFAGGVFDRRDIDHYIELGCAGVQMATRFVVTEECDAAQAYKDAYIQAKPEDVAIIQSPVGMKGRAINNAFVSSLREGKKKIRHCYQCLAQCDIQSIPYCITQALIQAAKGETDQGLIFAGAQVGRIDRMTTVKELIRELTD